MKGLQNTGVLVTRPAHQSAELVQAIETAGGHAVRFPVIDIVRRADEDIRKDQLQLARPDIIVFVSSNAVMHGIEFIEESQAQFAAVGLATKKAIEAAGRTVDIFPEIGFDSEHLLEAAGLQDVSGRTVQIVRGNGGRELLAETLRQRGATVDYLETYRRCAHAFADDELAQLEKSWQRGGIQYVIAMSVDSLRFFLMALPDACQRNLSEVSLVTPSKRVIQTALDKAPGMQPVLASGPGTDDMLQAMIDDLQQRAGAP